ncbi:hypothetical protein VCHA53O463_120007 [Vibrio chagasii]|nr:hypothetical protein VCHA53O463_120007 [Vibrio chagasii]
MIAKAAQVQSMLICSFQFPVLVISLKKFDNRQGTLITKSCTSELHLYLNNSIEDLVFGESHVTQVLNLWVNLHHFARFVFVSHRLLLA